MAISKKVRFEVFKRDNFQCQYCGKQPNELKELLHSGESLKEIKQ